ncbi:unnamed protein product [Paramecium sonneborni]|uniref:Uncharacterized protein n=1 Tax=Paramecium sonneborni TaxID=65129 RepID=A0A8S1QX67_9CILI|nr:unnamed protein product [Paramecium sonneborni]
MENLQFIRAGVIYQDQFSIQLILVCLNDIHLMDVLKLVIQDQQKVIELCKRILFIQIILEIYFQQYPMLQCYQQLLFILLMDLLDYYLQHLDTYQYILFMVQYTKQVVIHGNLIN